MLANNFPGWPRSALPAQWARGYWEDETGEVPAKSCFNSRRCTITPGKTVAWVYSFCEDPGGCFFYILIPASYILQETQSSPPAPPRFLLWGLLLLQMYCNAAFHSPNPVCNVSKRDRRRQADRSDRCCARSERGFSLLLPVSLQIKVWVRGTASLDRCLSAGGWSCISSGVSL